MFGANVMVVTALFAISTGATFGHVMARANFDGVWSVVVNGAAFSKRT